MKLLIIEDELLTAERLASLVAAYDKTIEITACIPSVSDAITWLKENEEPDLILMDIHLEDGDCFQIFEQVNIATPVIFTTAFDEYMVKAFKVNSIDYLMKPVDYDEFVSAMEKYKNVRSHYQETSYGALLKTVQQPEEHYKDRFLISNGTRLRTVEIPEVKYFLCRDKITFLVTPETEFLPVDYSLDKLSLMLDPRKFFRINRHLMVSLPAISNIHVYPKGKLKLELSPGLKEEVYVSLDRVTAFKEWLGK
ncbi:MAG TPA: LytTR family DNA-binding domain-containing protein [Sphingobacteriaceae bacterium]